MLPVSAEYGLFLKNGEKPKKIRIIITIFSRRKREVKKLATSGMQNSEIAEKLNIYLSSVKHAIRIFSGKTGTKREDFAAFS